MEYIKQEFPSIEVCRKMYEITSSIGTPTESRLLIWTPDEKVTKHGTIIIPNEVKEDIPRKGVIIGIGGIPLGEYASMRDMIEVGNIVTFGMYAGKEVFFDSEELEEFKGKFHVISLNEIIFIEFNKNVN